jgi:hypothetical protein
MMLAVMLLLAAAQPDVWSYWVQPCTAGMAKESGCQAGDGQLAVWALEAWQRAAPEGIRIVPADKEETARLRIYWASGQSQLYGEARPVLVGGKRGAEVFVLPGMAKAGEDALMRDTVVYLTCLHESGHGLGLAHTRQFEDIMYSFQFGGDIGEYFGRYRRLLSAREDIRKHSGISPNDRAALLQIFGK